MMLEEMLFHPDMADTPDARAAGWLMFISMFRDDMPWLYEVGLELYHALKSNDPEEIEGAIARLERVAKIVIRGPWSPEMMGVDDEETFMMMRHLPEILSNVLGRLSLTGGKNRETHCFANANPSSSARSRRRVPQGEKGVREQRGGGRSLPSSDALPSSLFS